jgi:hypothetical protein
VVGLFGGNLLELGTFMYRNDEFFMLLARKPENAHDFLENATHGVHHDQSDPGGGRPAVPLKPTRKQ